MASRQVWIRLASCCGLASIFCYLAAAFLPLPDVIGRLLAFAFGPLLIASFLGSYRFLREQCDGPMLQLACLFGVLAGTIVTSLLVIQVGNNMVRADLLSAADTESAREAINLEWNAVNRVQYLLDVVWDIFLCAALTLLAIALLRHPQFGKLWGVIGIVVGTALLALNLYTFPEGPAYAGSVDLGPLAALWMLAVFVRMFFLNTKFESTAPLS